ncbi:MAG: hypothetical protein MZV64_67785, partial [Ignavibacteriales bacterium]|nr:hypothetical protein [Ignavibacteriales bacterium]
LRIAKVNHKDTDNFLQHLPGHEIVGRVVAIGPAPPGDATPAGDGAGGGLRGRRKGRRALARLHLRRTAATAARAARTSAATARFTG